MVVAEHDTAGSDARQLLMEADRAFPFGPSFFLHHILADSFGITARHPRNTCQASKCISRTVRR